MFSIGKTLLRNKKYGNTVITPRMNLTEIKHFHFFIQNNNKLFSSFLWRYYIQSLSLMIFAWKIIWTDRLLVYLYPVWI